jgi:two-component sensor histidine kinase/FixJ family two-component response regulator
MNTAEKNILLVDDSEANLEMLSEPLIAHGYRVRAVKSGAGALKTIEVELPDLVLLDIKMPVMDGYEVCRLLKAGERTRGIPVIFISGMMETQEKVKAFEAGGVDYITKPLQTGEVLERVRTHIELRDMRERLEKMNVELEARVAERTQQLEKTVEQMREEIRERLLTEEALRNLLSEKEVLLREVHHRVKNNLQVVQSLLALQAGATDNQQALHVLQDTSNRINSMALLHDMLCSFHDLAHIDFAQYVDELCRQLVFSIGPAEGRIRIINRVSRVEIPLDKSVPCGLIINELVSNAIKHAFPDERSGIITVDLHAIDTGANGTGGSPRMLLRVSDDGTGMTPDIDPQKASSLGMQLVSALAVQLGGTMYVERPENGGCTFSIAFKI